MLGVQTFATFRRCFGDLRFYLAVILALAVCVVFDIAAKYVVALVRCWLKHYTTHVYATS